MAAYFERITDLNVQADVVRRRHYGVIEMSEGRFVGLHFRPWPKLIL